MEQKVLININRLGGFVANIDTALEIIQNLGKNDISELDRYDVNQLISWFKVDRSLINREILERYNKICLPELSIPFTLAEPEIIEQRIFSPLVLAKRLFCLGDFIPSIALSGLVGEMLTVLIWDINLEERVKKAEKLKHLNGNFDTIRQATRIDILEACEYINPDEAKIFRKLKNLRNDMLHKWTDSYSRDKIQEISMNCFSFAASLVKKNIKVVLADAGTLSVDPKIMSYINKRKQAQNRKDLKVD